MIGQTFGHYRIEAKLGEGGMGVVYRARDLELERTVALKLIEAGSADDETARARLLREARSASALNHPNICTIYEVGEAGGQAYIAMEYVEGRPLGALVPAGGLPVEKVLRYGIQIADALAHAHDRGIIHRDLKSSNVVVTADGRAKILDFGLAKRFSGAGFQPASPGQQDAGATPDAATAEASLTKAGAIAGTLQYMAPEVLKGQPADARSDVWALGVLLYELAAGKLPFQGQTGFELSSAILREPPGALPEGFPQGLRAIVQRALAKEPGERYQRAGEIRAALEAIQSGATLAASVAPPSRRPEPKAGETPALQRRWAALGVAILVVGALAVLLGLDVGGLRDRLFHRGTGAPKIESIAVLPLENLSHDPEQEYFADGMTEELITDLAKIRALKVISRTSIMHFKGTQKTVPEIAKELNVDAVLEGSVLRSGNRVRITAQLVYAPSDRHLWAESYERDLKDVLSMQDEVAQAIAGEIQIALTPQERTRLASARPVNPEAHELYLRGRYYWDRRTAQGLQRSIEYFQRAIQKDPGYAQAYAGLADSFVVLPSYGATPPREAFPKAKAAAEKAIQIDDTVAEAYACLANVVVLDRYDWLSGEREFQRAIELNPNYATARQWHGLMLNWMGQLDRALGELKRAQELDPLSLIIYQNIAGLFYDAGKWDEAIEEARKALELDPSFGHARNIAALSYVRKGMHEQGIDELRKSLSLSGGDPKTKALLAYAYAVAGKRKQAEEELPELIALSKRSYFSPYFMALIYVGLGETDQALAWLDRGYEERDPWITNVKMAPAFDPLRSDPRFQDLLRRMHFPP